jgi:glycosyltransferase involved in cell wall biosynthesis
MMVRLQPSHVDPKPVAVVTATIPGTISTFDRELIRQVQAKGYDVCLVSSPGPLLDRIGAEMGVRIQPIAMTRKVSPLADLTALVLWLRFCFTERPALMISATPKASLLSLLAAKIAHVHQRLYCLVGLRLEGEHGGKRKLLAEMEKLTSWASTDVIANSPSLATRYAEMRLAPPLKLQEIRPGSDHGVDSIHYAPQPCDPELASTLGIDRSIPVVGLVGRLTHDKGVDALILAMDLLRMDAIACQLLVVGAQDEPDSAAYLDALTSMGERVVAVGKVDDVRPYFALMDVHVLPSLREGFPNVVLEASAMGLPTITTDATGAIDSVRHGETGLIVKTHDPRGLADAIKTLLGDRELASQYGAEARRWVIDEFQPRTIVQKLLELGNVNGAYCTQNSDDDLHAAERR